MHAGTVAPSSLLQPAASPRPRDRWARRSAALRLLAKEAWSLCLTQPIRPFFRFLRAWRGIDGTPIVFVHGYAQSSVTFWGLAVRLARRRIGPMYAFDYLSFASIPTIAERLGAEIERVREATGSDRVHLVAHSLGGVVVLEYLRQGGHRYVEHCVTIGAPHAGVRWKGPIFGACSAEIRAGAPYITSLGQTRCTGSVLNITSAEDDLFFDPGSASLAHRGGHDVILERGGHLSMLFDPEVAERIAAFLEGGLEGRPVSQLRGRRSCVPAEPPSEWDDVLLAG
jgi:predicted alpha/beta hydrolase family esterase